MNIKIGSLNPVKIAAVKETLLLYKQFARAVVNGKEVSSEVNAQPFSLEETIRGARNRARNAFEACHYSIGIESGIMHVQYAETQNMDVCACAIYDGVRYHLGLSPAFEYPPTVMQLLHKGKEVNDAFFELGFALHRKLGNQGGAIGFLTQGLMERKEYTKSAIMMALIPLLRPDLYPNSQP